MRISSNMMTEKYIYSMNKNLSRQAKLQEQMADGKAIHRPSDDPVKAIRSLRYNTSLSINEQYTKNSQAALSWMTTTDGVMADVSSSMIKLKELTVKAGNGTNEETAMQAMAKEINGIIDHLVQIGNTKSGDRFIFSGQQDKVSPFTRMSIDIGGGVMQDIVVYNGDQNKISMPVQPGAGVDPRLDSVNLHGAEVFGPLTTIVDANGVSYNTLSVFDHLIELKDTIAAATTGLPDDPASSLPPYTPGTSSYFLELNNRDHSQVELLTTELGARMNQYEMMNSMLKNESLTITEDISDNEDIDVSKALLEMNVAENLYRASLAVGARLLPTSLVDFLR